MDFKLSESRIKLNDRRVIQLSTAVRSISKSPYIVRDFLKIERGKWNLGLFYFHLIVSKQLRTFWKHFKVIIHLDAIANYFDKMIVSIFRKGLPKLIIDFLYSLL